MQKIVFSDVPTDTVELDRVNWDNEVCICYITTGGMPAILVHSPDTDNYGFLYLKDAIFGHLRRLYFQGDTKYEAVKSVLESKHRVVYRFASYLEAVQYFNKVSNYDQN